MKFNSAVYAAREDTANARQAVSIKLDASGNAENTRPTGQAFTISEVIAAQQAQSYQAYQGAMTFLDGIIGDDADTATRKAFDRSKSKFQSVEHATEMRDKLMTAALNGSNVALIAYAAASLFLNPYAAVDFSWFVNGSDDLKVIFDLEGYQAVQIAVSTSIPFVGDMADYEGFALTYRPVPAVPVTVSRPTPEKTPSPTATPTIPVATPTKPSPVLPTVATIEAARGTLTQVIEGWQAESVSSPGQTHTTSHDGATCSCLGNTHHGHCWHRDAVMAHQSAEVACQLPRTATHNGIFTADLAGGHRSFKIKAQKEDASFMPGKRVVSLLTGSNPADWSDWTSFGVFRDCGEIALWKNKRGGKWNEYADLLAHPADFPEVEWNSEESCRFCNRMLTTPTSAKLGYGPTCAKKHGLPYAK